MPIDSALVIINKTNLDSGTDGTGSGSDPTASGGAVVSVDEGAEIGLALFAGPSDTGGEPGDADTLDVTVEVSVDGGSVWNTLADFRQILGSEIPDDTGAGDKTVRLGQVVQLPRADSGQSNLVKLRCNSTASDTSNWGLYVAVCGANDIRSEWQKQAVVA